MELNIELTDKQTETFNLLMDDKTEITLYGGQFNSGKSWLSSIYLLVQCLRYPGSRWVLGRKNITNLKKTSLKTFLDVCKAYGIILNKDFKINNMSNTIKFTNGSEIFLINLEYKPSDPDGHQFGGLEICGAVIEELPEVSQKYFEIIYSRIRYRLDDFGLTKKLLATCNPSNNWVKPYFYDRYIKGTLPEEVKFISTVGGINKYRGKNFEKSLSQLSEQELKRLEFGDWEYSSSEDQLFSLDKLENIFTGLQYGDNNYYISADIARFGNDSTVIVLWKGLQVIRINKYNKKSTTEVTDIILSLQNEFKVARNKVIVDSDGVGGGVMDQLKCKGFVNNAKPFKDEKYDMLKTQCYFTLAKTDWSISTSINNDISNQIRKELEAIRDRSDEFKYKINTKDQQKQLLGNSSPDFADAIMMRMYFLFSTGNIVIDAV